MLDKEDIIYKAQEWFDVDEKHAKLFAEDLLKGKGFWKFFLEYLPEIFSYVLIIFCVIYMIYHR